MTGIVPIPLGEPRHGGAPGLFDNFRETHFAAPGVGPVPGPVTVVLGSVDAPCPHASAGMDANGLPSPAGVDEALPDPRSASTPPERVIIRLADQRGEKPGSIEALHAATEGGSTILATRQEGRPGAQAWFSPVSFPELARLAGDQSVSSN